MTSATPSRFAWLEHFPVALFTISMGVFGLALALRAGGFEGAATVIGVLGCILLAILLIGLLAKAALFPAALKADWSHPIKIAFFPATSISILLMATYLHPAMPALASALWLAGAVAQGCLTLIVINAWIGHRAFGPGHLSPAWFIPAVGNVVAPFGGVPMGYAEISWYFFAVGLIFWLVLLTLVFNRLIFHDALPGKLRPTIVILVAPPALAFTSWVLFNDGEVDAVARILINIGYFFTALVALQMPALLRLPFALSFWALSFPLAAMTTATFTFANATGSAVHSGLGFVLLGLLVIAIAGLTIRTGHAARAGLVFVPD